MDDHTLSNQIHDAWIIIERSFNPAIKPLVVNSQLSLREWMLILAALTFEPEDTTPSHLLVRGPYTSSEKYLQGLEKAAEIGYLSKVANGRFRLTQSGRNAAQEFIDTARDAMVFSKLLPPQESIILAQLLERLLNNCLETIPPPNTWSIDLSYKLMPAIDPPMPFIEQAISCLSAYRDDAHLSSWRSSGLSAIAMEILTLVWRGQAESFNQINSKLEFRGHQEKIYYDAIVQLRTHKYITGISSKLKITPEGKQFRDRVEEKTDQFFYHPWTCLTDGEKEQMAQILSQIESGL